jgi:hypothetical protein
MAKDLAIMLHDRPGTMAGAAETLGKAGINIEGIFGLAVEGKGLAHVLVEDGATARQALQDAGYEIREEPEVLVIDIEDRPGALGEVTKRIADAGVNLHFLYLATRTRLVLGPEDLEKAKAAL